ncbi:hypothetical protein [Maridesulfovibrio hydrothermalis]|uniref:Uncharacterized protein n=1 Tax=Maridesulfovibrio hydrothermalis AM13 = DSM 14728 TaxID=1121451 RepID=L0RH30_9BACT|nr:hypothetical protein [Maridesulfovibrio hydrothermalis]CCO25515.1 exported protein of unknown function [Maridesulfovibrio hydrothermalis AM13 = DSM 14728]
MMNLCLKRIDYMKSIKILLICFVTVATLSSASIGYCDSGFLDGFRGIQWNTAKKDLPDLDLSKKTLKNIYKKGSSAIFLTGERTNLDMHFDEVPLLSIFLRFNDSFFYGYDLVFKPQYMKKVQASVEKSMGAAGKKIDGELHWNKDGVAVILTDRELMVEKK